VIAICILGMHRSGTSTVTRAFNLLGVYIGEDKDLMKPLPDNPEGYWERLDVYYLQERLLSIMKRDWATAAPLTENWHKSEEVRSCKDELIEIVKVNFSGQPLWLWKDPRTCLLLPLWKDVLSELGIGLKVVFVVRNPIDVARSLEKRNGFTTDKGLGIWFNHTINALKGLEGLETVFLSYDNFMDDWETELKKCADGLRIPWPDDEAELKVQMANFVRRDLRHSVSGLDELKAMKVPEPIIRLYGLLLDIQSGTWESDATGSMTEVMYQEFLSYARLFDYDMAALADCRSLLEDATTSPEALPKLVELKNELDARTEWAWRLDEEVKSLREQVASLKKVLSEQQPPLSQASDNTLQDVLNSMSWKVTKPLRVVHGILLKLRKDQ